MSNVLVIVYSHTGTSRKVAELLCSQQGWRLADVADAHPRSGALGTWRCLLDAFFQRQPAIRYDGPPPGDFDAVVLVSPIWMLRLAGPMRSFVAQQRHRLPNVAVVSVMGGEGAPTAAAEIGELLGHAPLMTAEVTRREVDDGSCAVRLQAFGTAMRSAGDSQSVVRPAPLSPQAI